MARGHVVNMNLPLCTLQVACDGAVIKKGSTACHRCRDKQAKKERMAKSAAILRGENTCVSGSERREVARLKREQ